MPDCSTAVDESTWDCAGHPGFIHADSWDQIEGWLARGLKVLDGDGDVVAKVNSARATAGPAREEEGLVILQDYAGQLYEYRAKTILLEEDPVTPEEEDEAIASILRTMQKF